MIQALIPIITAILGQSHNKGAQKTAGLVNSAANFIHKTAKENNDR